jgi:hypothetical protein
MASSTPSSVLTFQMLLQPREQRKEYLGETVDITKQKE